MRLEGTDYLSVTAAPPQFDPVAYVQSVDRLAVANFQRLYLTHFGAIDDVAEHLAGYRARIVEVYDRVAAWHAEGLSEVEVRSRYLTAERSIAAERGLSAEQWAKCEGANGTAMCADGVLLCCQKSSSI